jgi:tRNA-dihydrouridine synthase
MNIWQSLPKPFFVLAPMDDVTDTVFRSLVAACAPPDLMFTEFASVDGLFSNGHDAVMKKLQFDPAEKPLIAQVWGLQPDNYLKAAQELVEMGFDGIDINMGCPVPKVLKMGACSALIENRELAQDIITATKEGAAGRIPISVKTRIGLKFVDLSWTEFLLQQDIAALTVHGRTSKQQSKVHNDWEQIDCVRQQRDTLAPNTIIVGNGDVLSRNQGIALANEHKLDGIMIGRGVFHDPYIFAQNSPWENLDPSEKIALYSHHIEQFGEVWGPNKNPSVLKKFAKVYIQGFEGASDFRAEIMEADTLQSLQDIVTQRGHHAGRTATSTR